jgi:hypothetical protein
MPPKKPSVMPKGKEPTVIIIDSGNNQEPDETAIEWVINLETLDINVTKDEFLKEYLKLEPKTIY